MVAGEDDEASEVGFTIGLPLQLAPRHHLLVGLHLQKITPDLPAEGQLIGSRILWIAGSRIEDPGFVGSRIRLTEDQRRPEREGSGAGWGSILRVIVHFFFARLTNKQNKFEENLLDFILQKFFCPKMVF